MISEMSHAGDEMRSNAIALGNHFLHRHVDIGESAAEISIDRLEPFGADKSAAGFRKIVSNAISCKHRFNGGFIALVPDSLEPLTHEVLVRFRHEVPPWSQRSTPKENFRGKLGGL